MNFEKVVTEIKSVREFTKQKLDLNLVKMILSDLDNLRKIEDLDLTYEIVENGPQFAIEYSGKIGYFGKLIEAPNYILVFGQDSDKARINTGYNLEWVRFSLFEAGIGSCWVSTVDAVDYAALFGKNKGDTLLGCLAIGEEYSGIFKKNIDQKSERKGVAEFVYRNSWKNEITWEELELLGLDEVFYLTKFAPSWGNCQPWSFIVDDHFLKLFINRAEGSNYSIDAGIISFYLMKAAESRGLTLKAQICDEAAKEILEGFESTVIFTM